MLSYLDYEKNEEDERCLVNIFGRYSSSSEDEQERRRDDIKKKSADDDERQIKDEIEVIPETSMTSYHLNHRNLIIEIETNRIKGIAHQLWPASYLLCNYLETHLNEIFKDSGDNVDVIELGAGVGLSGIVFGILLEGRCRHVLLTDLPEAQELIQKNIQRNQHLFPSPTQVTSDILHWGVPTDYQCYHPCQLIEDDSIANTKRRSSQQQLYVIAADCVYWEHLYEPFYQTLHHFISTYDATVLLSHFKRWKKEKKFFSLCSKNFHVEIIYEKIEMVPVTDEHLDASHLPSNEQTPSADGVGGLNRMPPMRKQISRIYLMKRKEILCGGV